MDNCKYLPNTSLRGKNICMDMGEKIRRLRKEKDLTQKDLANALTRALGKRYVFQQVGSIENGSRPVYATELRVIHSVLGCTLDYLLDNSKDYPPSNSNRLIERPEDFPGKIRLTQPDRVAEVNPIPLVGYVSAGETDVAYGDAGYPTGHGIGEIGRPPGLDDPHAYAVIIRGDSMCPAYPEGTIAFIDTTQKPKVKDIVICRERITGKVYIKELKRQDDNSVVLASFNEQEHDPMVFNVKNLYFIHKCVWFKRV